MLGERGIKWMKQRGREGVEVGGGGGGGEGSFLPFADSLFLLLPSPPPQELSDTKAIGEGF